MVLANNVVSCIFLVPHSIHALEPWFSFLAHSNFQLDEYVVLSWLNSGACLRQLFTGSWVREAATERTSSI